MKRKIYLFWGNDDKYEVASDATVSFEYSETLDSASIVLPNVSSARTIVYNAKPYDEVYVKIVLEDGTEEFGEHFLIDSVDAAQVSFSGTAYFDVTLQLMSETKYLEKIQLPNVSVTHSQVNGAKTLYDAISYFVNTYSPEYTGTSGRTSLLSMDSSADWSRFKSAKCSDVMMSKPTLRQCLTTLFTQVGCIPVVKNRKLTYLDLSAPKTRFMIDRKAPGGSVRRSVSSDSWVNTLVAESSQSVDKESTCVVESLCFRDRSNVLLKQTDNLKLETRYPIYEVKKLVLNSYVKGKINFNQSYLDGGGGLMSSLGPGIAKVDNTGTGGPGAYAINMVIARNSAGVLKLKVTPCTSALYRIYAYCNLKIHQVLATVNDDNSLTIKKTMDNNIIDSSVVFAGVKQSETTTWSPIYFDTFDESDYTGKEITLVTYSIYNGTIGYGTEQSEKWVPSDRNPNVAFVTDSYTGADNHGQYMGYFSFHPWTSAQAWGGDIVPLTFYREDTAGRGFYSRCDITPLCVESSKRAQLEVDFVKMPEWSTIKEMSKYLYATVGYTIGETSIEGFSATYTQLEKTYGFWDTTKTYIENIMDSVGAAKEGISRFYGSIFPQDYWAYLFGNPSIGNPFFTEKHNNFSVLFFDIEYVPLIQGKTAYDKEDVALPLEQLDSAESGVSDMDSVTTLEEQKADRLGNPVWAVHARVDSYADLPALNSQWDGKVAFKRTLKFGANAIDAEYVLSEDYVIANYFTSIMTKYRAYEYVDYSQSVERRELVKAYIRLSPSDSGNAKNIWTGKAKFPTSQGTARTLINSLEGYQDASTRLTGGGYLPPNAGYATECELSAVTTGNKCVLTIKEFDNISDGPYVDGTYLTINGDYYDDPIGGVPQRWYESRDYANTAIPNIIIHGEEKQIRPTEWGEDADAYVSQYVRKVQQWPRYYFYGDAKYPTTYDYDVYWLVTFPFDEKDMSELLSLSIQFEACWCPGKGGLFSDKSKGRFSKWLFRFSSAISGYPSEGAYLAYRPMAVGEAWLDKKKATPDDAIKIDPFLTWVSVTSTYSVHAAALQDNANSPIEILLIDGDDAYPLAWFAKRALSSSSVYMTCVPAKSDKTLGESIAYSLLYETA